MGRKQRKEGGGGEKTRKSEENKTVRTKGNRQKKIERRIRKLNQIKQLIIK